WDIANAETRSNTVKVTTHFPSVSPSSRRKLWYGRLPCPDYKSWDQAFCTCTTALGECRHSPVPARAVIWQCNALKLGPVHLAALPRTSAGSAEPVHVASRAKYSRTICTGVEQCRN
ncbi:unnamed protein product, partial [Ixodes pacificus]